MKDKAAATPTTPPIGQVTQQEIDAWKANEANREGVYYVKAGNHIAYFRKPLREDINCAFSKASREATLEMYDELAEQTFLGGSRVMLENTQKFLAVKNELTRVLDGEKAEVVNL